MFQEAVTMHGIKDPRVKDHRIIKAVNHKRIERIMRQNGIKSRVSKKLKATTNSNHRLLVAENILNHDFTVDKPNEKIKKELVINALNDAYQRAGRPTGVILHSDRGSQYCSNDYQLLFKKYGFVCSMSHKSNYWDNAPMESFWGRMKCE